MLSPFFKSDVLEAGCDEAGRGALAGPVVAAAVILDLTQKELMTQLDDSKKLSAKKREALAILIKESAVAYGVGVCSPQEIDEINILQAAIRAMHKALDQLDPSPQHILVDGHYFHPFGNIPHECMKKGDARFASIAAASILAKTTRDHMMQELAQKFPIYSWQTNMAYATVKHYQAIEKYGITPHHRQSFKLKKEVQIKLFD